MKKLFSHWTRIKYSHSMEKLAPFLWRLESLPLYGEYRGASHSVWNKARLYLLMETTDSLLLFHSLWRVEILSLIHI